MYSILRTNFEHVLKKLHQAYSRCCIIDKLINMVSILWVCDGNQLIS